MDQPFRKHRCREPRIEKTIPAAQAPICAKHVIQLSHAADHAKLKLVASVQRHHPASTARTPWQMFAYLEWAQSISKEVEHLWNVPSTLSWSGVTHQPQGNVSTRMFIAKTGRPELHRKRQGGCAAHLNGEFDKLFGRRWCEHHERN